MDRYEQALERAKQGLPLDEVFPELKESVDERIRRAIISVMERSSTTSTILENENVSYSDALAWLEKQK